MKNKRKLLYLIPIGTLFIFGAISTLFFYLAVVAPLMNIKKVEINRTIETTLSEDSFMSIFVKDLEITNYEIVETVSGYQIICYQDEDAYQITFEVTNSDGEDAGYYVRPQAPNQTYTFDNYMNVTDIVFQEDDTYYILIASYDDLPGEFGYSISNSSDAGVKLTIATVTGIIAIVGSIGSLVYILIRNSKA